MKILFINSVVDYGSTGKIVRALSDELLKKCHEVKMVYGRHDVKDTTNTIDIRDKNATYFHVLMTRIFGRHGLHSTRATQKLINEISQFNPDVIHIHNVHGYYLDVPMLLDYLNSSYNGKIIWTLHDAWLVSGSSAYFDFNGSKIWNDGCEVCNNTKDYPRSDFGLHQRENFKWKREKLQQLKNVTFISPSQWLVDLLDTTFLRDKDLKVVNNGIDLTVFKPTASEKLSNKYQGKKIILGVASLWERRKGLEDFIKLSSMISSEYVIILIGLTKEQIKQLPRGIVGIERTSDATELAAYYSAAHVFLNPTYEDNYPTTNLEALACNTPVIAYDTGGNKEVPGIIIVEQGNLEHIVSLLNDDLPRKTRQQSFSTEAFINNMMPYYGVE